MARELFGNILTQKDMHSLNLFIIAGIGIFIIKGLLNYGQRFFMALAGERVVQDMRNRIFTHLQHLNISFHLKQRTGDLMSRTINDIDIIGNTIIEGLSRTVPQLLLVVGLLGRAFWVNWSLALMLIVLIPVAGIAIVKFGQYIRRLTTMIQEKIADIASRLQEKLSGIATIKAFSREEYEIEKMRDENKKNFLLSIRRFRLLAIQEPGIEFLAILGIFAILWFSGRKLIAGELSGGELADFFACVALLIDPIVILSRSYSRVQKALAASSRYFEVLNVQSEIKEKEDAIELKEVCGEITFTDVSFEYEGKDGKVLNGVTMKVLPGEMVALVGSSGVGKSTLINLIPRFFDVTAGSIKIDGHDIRELKLSSLRRAIGIVPQEPLLFSGTVKENIRYGNLEASDDEVTQAAILANAHEFITRLPKGYETEVGERGVRLSIGQRQRIAIARVLLKDAKIILLDEPTSALDAESEHLVKLALERLMQKRTNIIIAHRLSTVQKAEKIFVLNNGKIEESGTHIELLRQNGLYRKLYELQLLTSVGDLQDERDNNKGAS
jgi:subfamily B ATP-binding cassette protein MsbA